MKKRTIFNFTAAASLMISACTNAPDSDKAKTSEAKEVAENTGGNMYKIVPSSSAVEWIGTKVSGYHSGMINVKSGELAVNDGNITGGNFIMEMGSIQATGPADVDEASNGKLTGHLKSPDFFDVEKFPDATFVITEVKPFSGTVADQEDTRQEAISKYKVSNPSHTVSGNLTIKGITKNIEFPALITMNDNSAEATAMFNIDRSQWDIVYPGKPDDLIRNDIHLGVKIMAAK